MPPDLSSLCVHASVHTRVQLQVSWANAILLLPGLYPAVHTVQFGGRGPLNFTTREARAPIAPPIPLLLVADQHPRTAGKRWTGNVQAEASQLLLSNTV